MRAPTWRQTLLGMVGLLALAFLQGSGYLRLGSARVTADYVLCAVVAWAFLYGPSAGAVWGFIGGLLLDGLSVGPFGSYCLVLALIGALVGVARLGQYSEEVGWVVAAAVSGSLAFYAAAILMQHLAGGSVPIEAALSQVLIPVLLLNAAVTVVMVAVLRRGGRRRYGRFEV